MVYVLRSNFGVLWSDGLDSGVSSWFEMGISEALLVEIVAILVCFGPMVGIQERDVHVLCIMVPHALSSYGVEYIAFIVAFVIVDYVDVGD